MHPNLPSGFNPLLTLAARETKIAALAAKVEIMPKLIFAMAFAIVPGVIAVPDTAHAACKVEGVWEQVSLTWDGRVMHCIRVLFGKSFSAGIGSRSAAAPSEIRL